MKLLVLLLTVSGIAYGANILGIYTTHSPSHNIIHIAEVNALIEKGQNVTVITMLPLKENNPKYHHVYIPPPKETWKKIEDFMEVMSNAKGLSSYKILPTMISARQTTVNMQYELMFTEEFQKVINGDTKFDLLILGYMLNDFQLAIAQQLKVPVVLSWVNFPEPMVNDIIGNPNGISYVPSPLIGNEQPMNFMNRLKNYIINILMYGGNFFAQYKMKQYYE